MTEGVGGGRVSPLSLRPSGHTALKTPGVTGSVRSDGSRSGGETTALLPTHQQKTAPATACPQAEPLHRLPSAEAVSRGQRSPTGEPGVGLGLAQLSLLSPGEHRLHVWGSDTRNWTQQTNVEVPNTTTGDNRSRCGASTGLRTNPTLSSSC